MAYDLHGVWKKPHNWVGPYLNAHTNLTEIKDDLDLFWRNGINPDKVTLGLAFYGRGFTASSPECLTPGCRFDCGSNAQDGSREVGVVLNSEIDDIITSRGVAPTLDAEAAVKILTWDNDQWLAYDDGDTFALKADFARSQCLGGLTVQAVSHDTKDAKYSRALGRVARRQFNAVMPLSAFPGQGADKYEYVTDYEEQCLWTGCNERESAEPF
jgi:GH18 family chitinase